MIVEQIQRTLDNIMNLIDPPVDSFNQDSFKKIKSVKSAKVLSGELGISEQMFAEFEETIRQFYSFKDDPARKKIACFRISLWLETISKNLNIPFDIDEAISNEELAIKQVRALELIIRDVVTENLGGKENVLSKLQSLFKQDIVDKWIKSADQTGVLSGTTFSELSNIFLDKNIFKSVEEIFNSSAIQLTKTTRDSLRYILEDIRLIRNAIAHNKKISKIQIEALNEYYCTIAKLLNESKVNAIDPEKYLDLSKANMENFISGLKLDNKLISGNIEEVKENLVGIKKDTGSIKKRVVAISVVVLLILFITGVILFLVKKQSDSSSEVGQDIKDVKKMIDRKYLVDSSSYQLKKDVENKYFSTFNNYLNSEDYVQDSLIFYNFLENILPYCIVNDKCIDQSDIENMNQISTTLDLKNHFKTPSHFKYILLARNEKNNRNFVGAKRFIDTALIFSKNAYSYSILSDCTTNKDSSLDYLNKAIDLDPNSSIKFLFLYRSQKYYEIGDFNQALFDINKFLSIYPKGKKENYVAILWKFSVLFDSGSYLEACNYLQEIKKNYPKVVNCITEDNRRIIKENCN